MLFLHLYKNHIIFLLYSVDVMSYINNFSKINPGLHTLHTLNLLHMAGFNFTNI